MSKTARARAARSPAKMRVRKQGVAVVGIGASAGGLEAIETFLSAVPDNSGFAFVVVQHLDPTRASALPELLQRVTAMPVVEVRSATAVRSDRVYVIPPGRTLCLKAGRLTLQQPSAPRGLRLPIDAFFHSLATDCGARGSAVLLSGMGQDGTEGMRSVQAAGGRTFAQLPATAGFDDMPRSAIAAGVAGMVGAPAELAQALVNPVARPSATGADTAPLRRILDRVRAETGHDFTEYKSSTILRRIELRLAHLKLESIADYAELTEREPKELALLAQSMLIGVTSFFRDPDVWEQLARDSLPRLLQAVPAGGTLRVWAPACSTGEEAYTLAILLLEALDALPAGQRPAIRIFATDIDAEAIDTARLGLYPMSVASQISAARLKRYFTQEPLHYRLRKSVRELVVFAQHDLISDPPFTRVDLVTCRNLLIYLTVELQQKLLRILHYSLNVDGVLLLGMAETIGNDADAFAAVDPVHRIFRRLAPRETARGRGSLPSLPSAGGLIRVPRGDGSALVASPTAQQALFKLFVPPAVVVDDDGEVLHLLGTTSRYLDAPGGRRGHNLQGLAKPSLRRALAELLAAVPRGRDGRAVRESAKSRRTAAVIRMTARRLIAPASLRGLMLIAFEDVATSQAVPPRGASQRAYQLALQRAHKDAESLRLENLRSREQLNSANQELQSLNEELQSANEELTTSKEETQSMNEELQTVNAELQSKLGNLSLVNDDLRNLLDSTDIAIVFLDAELNVRRFTRQSSRVVRLIAGDVGRPLADIKTDLDYAQFDADIREVLRSLVVSEKEVATHDGRWYQVRIMPYQTIENVNDGAVITFTDVSAAKHLEQELRRLESVATTGGHAA
jgi:two-component system, chemotaxis family, CheB/CheR fusion protein